MKKIRTLTFASLGLLVAGCANMAETFFAHIVLDDGFANLIARGNATVNICMADELLDKNLGYAFNNVSAQILDLTVVDRPLYKQRYERHFSDLQNNPNKTTECEGAQRSLPQVIPNLVQRYERMSSELRVARAQERQQMSAMLANMGNNWSRQSYATTYSWPQVTYVEKQSEPTNWLVNTSKGLVQCRTTNKNYVFCM